nr:hypothetical protein [Tanacetum cinerariifolium]
NLQTELERTKERFENCIIKKENEYAKLWNDWYKKCEECKYDKISYDKAYNEMQQKIERLQAQLGDQKGKSTDTLGVSSTLDPLSQKLENKNVELEFQGLPKIDETHALSKPVTSNSIPTPQESKVMKNDNVIAPGMFRINLFKPYREEKYVPNKVRASIRTNPITVSQPHVISKKDVNSGSNGLSSTGVDNTTKTRRPQPRSNIKNNRVPSAYKSSCSKNKEVEVEEHPRNSLLSNNKKHMSTECNNGKLVIRNDKSKVICAMCKQCLITTNHDVCVLNYVNGLNSCGKKQMTNVSNTENQKKQKSKVMKPNKVGSNERLSSPKPSKPRSCLRWSQPGRLFDLKGKIIASSEFESQYDCSNGDNACTSNPPEPTIKRFPNSTSFLGRTNKIIETMNVTFDELLAMAFKQSSSKLELQSMTSGHISSGLDLTYAPSTITTQKPTERELDLLFEAMYDDYIGGQPSAVLTAQAPQVLQTLTTTTTTADTAPTPTNSSSQATNFPNTSLDVNELETQQQHVQHQPAIIANNVSNAMFDENTFVNPFATPSISAVKSSSSQYVDPSNMNTFYQPYPNEYQWTKDHPLEQVIGEPSRPVLTKNQLRSDGDMCMHALMVSTMEPKNVKEAMTNPAWIESMQEEHLQFKRLDVWVLVPLWIT